MPDHVCNRCHKTFQGPAFLRRHQNRKTPCAIIIEPEDLPVAVQADPELEKKRCHFCGRVFSSNNTKNRHIRKSCKIAPNQRNGNVGMELLYQHVLRQDAERAAQNAEIERLRGEVNELRQNQVAPPPAAMADRGGIAAGRDININVDQRNFTINVFGMEDTAHITREKVRMFFDDCIDKNKTARLAAHAAVEGLTTFIYCDPQHPENFTCYQPNQKEPVALVHTAQGWQSRRVADVLSPMTIRAVDEIFTKQPYVGYQKYSEMMLCISGNEIEFERGQDAKKALRLLGEYLRATLTDLPIEGGVLQLAKDATEPPPRNPPTRWKNP